MQRGLDGRRIALVASSKDAETRAETVRRALLDGGATVQLLDTNAPDEDWHGAKYAALVLIDGDGAASERDPPTRLVQLVREFLVSGKPLAAYGSAVSTVFKAGGVQGRTISAAGDVEAEIKKSGATCVDEDFHVDEALITARDTIGIEPFATRLVHELSSQLEERAVDEMSELSFPASDPPAVSPTSVGHLKQSEGRRAEG